MSLREGSGGYDEHFLEMLHSRYECTVCCHAMKEPVQVPCGHRLCKSCFSRLPVR